MDKILTEEQEKMNRNILKDLLTSWGIKAFDNEKGYTDWLSTPSKEFGGSRPVSLFDSMERMELLLLVLKQKYCALNNPK